MVCHLRIIRFQYSFKIISTNYYLLLLSIYIIIHYYYLLFLFVCQTFNIINKLYHNKYYYYSLLIFIYKYFVRYRLDHKRKQCPADINYVDKLKIHIPNCIYPFYIIYCISKGKSRTCQAVVVEASGKHLSLKCTHTHTHNTPTTSVLHTCKLQLTNGRGSQAPHATVNHLWCHTRWQINRRRGNNKKAGRPNCKEWLKCIKDGGITIIYYI